MNRSATEARTGQQWGSDALGTQDRSHEVGSPRPGPAGQEQSAGGQHPEPSRAERAPCFPAHGRLRGSGPRPASAPRPAGRGTCTRAWCTATDTGVHTRGTGVLGRSPLRAALRGFSSTAARGGSARPPAAQYEGLRLPLRGGSRRSRGFPRARSRSRRGGGETEPLGPSRGSALPAAAALQLVGRAACTAAPRRGARSGRAAACSGRPRAPPRSPARSPPLSAAQRGPTLRAAVRMGVRQGSYRQGRYCSIASPRPAAARLLPPCLPSSPLSPRSRRLRSRRRCGLQRRPPPGGQEARHHSGTAPPPSARLAARAAWAARPPGHSERGCPPRPARGAQPVPGREAAG